MGEHVMSGGDSIEEDATRVLLYMAAFVETDAAAATKGHARWEGPALANAVHLAASRLNDCVEILEANGYVDVLRYLGTRDFTFGTVTLTSRGRVEAERIEKQIRSQQDGSRDRVALTPTPTGSPFGFTDEDWEAVSLGRDDGSRLMVVFGHQWKSTYFESDTLRHNVGEMFQQALAAVSEHVRGEIRLDYRPLAGGYGGHVFNAIARDIISADIAVFEMSDNNANVMIELGVALTWGIRVLLIRKQESPTLPSDISGLTWAIYRDDGVTWHEDSHQHKLTKMCEMAIAKKKRQRG